MIFYIVRLYQITLKNLLVFFKKELVQVLTQSQLIILMKIFIIKVRENYFIFFAVTV